MILRPQLAKALGLLLFASVAAGCRSVPPVQKPQLSSAAAAFPARPTAAPAPFQLFHQTDNSLILVVPETASDPALAALLYQLREAAQAHAFGQLHLPQKFIDARQPKVFFHLYRGQKCAPETYAKGPYPCGASYHGAADFSIGGFSNPNATDGSLVAPDGAITHLWSAE